MLFSRNRSLTAVIVELVLLAVPLIGGLLWFQVVHNRLGPADFASGYVLLAGTLLLALLNVRKKLPTLPLGRMSTWLNVHVYLGFAAIVVFGAHVNWQWPNGWLESLLFWLFTLVSSSGVLGLVISRRYPQQISKLRDEAIWEQLPVLREQVLVRAQSTARELSANVPTSAVLDFYQAALLPFFVRATPWRQFVWRTSRTRNHLQSALRQMSRYCSSPEYPLQEQLARLVDQRDDLDFHAVQQGRLKSWLFVHIALTYALLIVAGLHTILAHAFQGS